MSNLRSDSYLTGTRGDMGNLHFCRNTAELRVHYTGMNRCMAIDGSFGIYYRTVNLTGTCQEFLINRFLSNFSVNFSVSFQLRLIRHRCLV